MKAITFNADVAKYLVTNFLGRLNRQNYYSDYSCINYADIEEPELPDENWVKIKTLYGGICGSDLNAIFLKDSPSISPFISFPFVFGHECLGKIVELGSEVKEFKIGDRVVINPLLSCTQRNIINLCPSCQNENHSLCENFAHGIISPGISIGYCKDTGGSWGEYFVAHKTQLFKVQEGVKDQDIIFTDPLASAIYPALKNLPDDNDNVLILGSGIIGILLVASLRSLRVKSNISILAKYGFQGERAKLYGADNVIYVEKDYFEKLGKIACGKTYKPIIGDRVMQGGFNKVFDCVGSKQSFTDGMWLTKAGGKLVIIGLVSQLKNIDMTPLWFKEIEIKGTFYYGAEKFFGQNACAYKTAVNLISCKKIDVSPLLSHKFEISDYKRAIAVASDKSKYESTKVVFQF